MECTKCNTEKSVDDFNFRDKKTGKRHTHCRDCQRLYKQAHYHRDRGRYKSRVLKSNKEIKARNREYVFNIKLGSKCMDCGEDDPNVLEFDHLRDKVADIGRLVANQSSLEKLDQEIKKCDIVCANCHRRRTGRRAGWYRDYTRE